MESEVASNKLLKLPEELPPESEEIHNILDAVWKGTLQSPKKTDSPALHVEQTSHKHAGVTPFPSKMRAIRDALTGNPLAPYRRLHQITEAPAKAEEPHAAATLHIFAEIGFLGELNPRYQTALSILTAWQPTDAGVNVVIHPIDNTLTTMALRDNAFTTQFTPEMELSDKLNAMQRLMQQARETQPKYYLEPETMYKLKEQYWSQEMAEQIKAIYNTEAKTSPVCVYIHDDLPIQNNEIKLLDGKTASSSAPCIRLRTNKGVIETDVITFESKQ